MQSNQDLSRVLSSKFADANDAVAVAETTFQKAEVLQQEAKATLSSAEELHGLAKAKEDIIGTFLKSLNTLMEKLETRYSSQLVTDDGVSGFNRVLRLHKDLKTLLAKTDKRSFDAGLHFFYQDVTSATIKMSGLKAARFIFSHGGPSSGLTPEELKVLTAPVDRAIQVGEGDIDLFNAPASVVDMEPGGSQLALTFEGESTASAEPLAGQEVAVYQPRQPKGRDGTVAIARQQQSPLSRETLVEATSVALENVLQSKQFQKTFQPAGEALARDIENAQLRWQRDAMKQMLLEVIDIRPKSFSGFLEDPKSLTEAVNLSLESGFNQLVRESTKQHDSAVEQLSGVIRYEVSQRLREKIQGMTLGISGAEGSAFLLQGSSAKAITAGDLPTEFPEVSAGPVYVMPECRSG